MANLLRINVCPADGQTCEVDDLVDIGLHPLLPCARCRVMERSALELKGWRPRRHQAAALLAAAPARHRRIAPYPEPGVQFDPEIAGPEISRSEREKLYEAVRSLRDRGLLFGIPPANRSRGGKGRLWRTPLGEEVVAGHGDLLARRARGEQVSIQPDRNDLKTGARLQTEKLREIFRRRERRVPDRIHATFDEALGAEGAEDNVFELGVQKAATLLALDEVDSRFNSHIADEWQDTQLETRAHTVVRARGYLKTARWPIRAAKKPG